MTHLLPCVKELVTDANQHVKSALASVSEGQHVCLEIKLDILYYVRYNYFFEFVFIFLHLRLSWV